MKADVRPQAIAAFCFTEYPEKSAVGAFCRIGLEKMYEEVSIDQEEP